MYEKAVGLGLGYLVYKRLMSELAKTPDNGGVTVKAGELLGWDKPAQFEEGLKLWAGVPDDCVVKGGYSVVCPPSENYQDWIAAGGIPKGIEPIHQNGWGIGGSLLPEGFDLEPSFKELGRPALRPKGL